MKELPGKLKEVFENLNTSKEITAVKPDTVQPPVTILTGLSRGIEPVFNSEIKRVSGFSLSKVEVVKPAISLTEGKVKTDSFFSTRVRQNVKEDLV